MRHSRLLTLVGVVFIATVFGPASAVAQETARKAAEDRSTVTGTVVSSTAGTLVVRTDANDYVLLLRNRDTMGPRTVPSRARVSVLSSPGEEPDTRVATSITVIEGPPQTREGAAAAPPQEPVPPAVRRLERDIARQVRRYRVGVRGGIALDPELVSVGAHARLGPFFDRDVSFRPNVEFAFGEVTTLLALNLEATYRLPLSPREGRWSAYVGAGPGLVFVDRGFETDEGDNDIDFDDLDLDAGLNILAGVEYRSGLFVELKGSAYAVPNLRLLVGFHF